jgi:hypothetical protein
VKADNLPIFLNILEVATYGTRSVSYIPNGCLVSPSKILIPVSQRNIRSAGVSSFKDRVEEYNSKSPEAKSREGEFNSKCSIEDSGDEYSGEDSSDKCSREDSGDK